MQVSHARPAQPAIPMVVPVTELSTKPDDIMMPEEIASNPELDINNYVQLVARECKLDGVYMENMTYYWTHKYPQEIVLHELGLSSKTVVDFYKFAEKCAQSFSSSTVSPLADWGRSLKLTKVNWVKENITAVREWMWYGCMAVLSAIRLLSSASLSQISSNTHSRHQTMDLAWDNNPLRLLESVQYESLHSPYFKPQ